MNENELGRLLATGCGLFIYACGSRNFKSYVISPLVPIRGRRSRKESARIGLCMRVRQPR